MLPTLVIPLSAELSSGSVSAMGTRWVCLCGFMGSGKTTVGMALAGRFGCLFTDLDDVVIAHEKRSVAEIFRCDGEAYFRRAEATALDSLLSTGRPPAVVALGGGAFIQEGNRARLRAAGALTICLDAPCDVLFERCCAQGPGRPLLQDRERFRQLYEQRRPVYLKAEMVIEVGERTPEEIVEEIADRLGRYAAVSE